MTNTNSNVSSAELAALKSENERLKARNADLYRDCVAFAKLIKASAVKDDQIDELQEEIVNLKSQIETLKETTYTNFSSSHVYSRTDSEVVYTPNITKHDDDEIISNQYEDVSSTQYDEKYNETTEDISSESDVDITYNPRIHYVDQKTFEDSMDDDTHEISPEEELKIKKKKLKKRQKFYKKLRSFIGILLSISVLITIVSGIGYLFSTTYKNYTVLGYRFASVTNSAMAPDITTSDAVLIKYCSFEGLKIDSLVVTEKNGRSIAKITDLSLEDGKSIATVSDKTGTYEVSESEFVGQVKFTIPALGNIVRYAAANSYNFAAIIVSVNLFLIAFLLLIPNGKAKPKRNREIDTDAFTI